MSAPSVTQFVAGALGLPLVDPPLDRRGAVQIATDPTCWLCGGGTGGAGWPLALAIAPTFTQHNCARAGDSSTVCRACVALTKAETYQAFVRSRALELKLWTQAGWHSYSHLVTEDGGYEAPKRDRMRAVTLAPPASRWVLAINTSGKKHTLFRGQVAEGGRDLFPVQLDEDTIWLTRHDWPVCLAAVEALTAAGASRDEACAGRYHPETLRRMGPTVFRALDAAAAAWRAERPDWIALAAVVADGPPKRTAPAPVDPIALAQQEGRLL